MDTIINVDHLGCKSGFKFLIQDINWKVKKGEHWLVFGMNGSGKTTLLSIIAGWKAHTHGKLEVFGEQYTDDNVLAIRRRIGWVSSSYFDKYFSKESALNIVLSGVFGTFGLDDQINDVDVIRAKELLCELRMKDKINYPFDLLSKGERQNVLIARALVSNPEILVLDEPGTGLDVFAREHLLSTVRDLAEKTEATIIYVTHYPEEIQPFLSKCLLLKNGKVYAQGETKKIFNDAFMSAFLEYPVDVKEFDETYYRMNLSVASDVENLLRRNVNNG